MLANEAKHRRYAERPQRGAEPSDADEGAEPSDVQELVYTTATVPVPPIALMAKGIGGGVKDNLKVRNLFATNERKLTKGDRICLREGLPEELPATRAA